MLKRGKVVVSICRRIIFDEIWEVLKEELLIKRSIKGYLEGFHRSFIYKEAKEILRNSTGILKTCCWEELSQFLGRF